MANNPKKTTAPTKKHQARLEREKILTRWIVICTALVLILAIGALIAGFVYVRVIQPNRSVASVNGEKINGKDFVELVRFNRSSLVNQAAQIYQFLQYFGNDPNTINQLQQIQGQLTTQSIGQQVLDLMIDNALIRQEAKRLGISVSEDEIQKQFQNELGYFPSGTPTSIPTLEIKPTSTLNPLQQTAAAPRPTEVITSTETLTATLVPTATLIPTPTLPLTPTATLAPTPSPTPYTEEGYKTEFQKLLETYKEYGVSEKGLKYILLGRLYRDRVKAEILKNEAIPLTREETWARHILVADEQTAKDLLIRLEKGEDWCTLAAELSSDSTNKDTCGDLGWFTREAMLPEFSDAAFSLPIGEISDPVKTTYGYHIIQTLGHEERSLTDTEYEQEKETRFTEWLTKLREGSKIETLSYWLEILPTEPSLPAEILNFLYDYQNNTQPQEQLPTDVTEATPVP